MNNFDKLRTIITLKKVMIHHQCWEFCAYLRDIERSDYKDLHVDKSACIKDNITQTDLHYIRGLVTDYVIEYPSTNSSKKELDIISIIDSEFIHLIREVKIDSILK